MKKIFVNVNEFNISRNKTVVLHFSDYRKLLISKMWRWVMLPYSRNFASCRVLCSVKCMLCFSLLVCFLLASSLLVCFLFAFSLCDISLTSLLVLQYFCCWFCTFICYDYAFGIKYVMFPNTLEVLHTFNTIKANSKSKANNYTKIENSIEGWPSKLIRILFTLCIKKILKTIFWQTTWTAGSNVRLNEYTQLLCYQNPDSKQRVSLLFNGWIILLL